MSREVENEDEVEKVVEVEEKVEKECATCCWR